MRQILRHEILHLAAALADQPNDDHVRGREPRHHAEQHALAYAAAGEEPQALTAPDRQQRIDRAHAHVERLANRPSIERIHGARRESDAVLAAQRPGAVERFTRTVDHTTEQRRAGPSLEYLVARNHACTRLHTAELVGGDEQQRFSGKAHDFGFCRAAVGVDDETATADRRFAARGFERHAGQATQHAVRHETARAVRAYCGARRAARRAVDRVLRGLVSGSPAPLRCTTADARRGNDLGAARSQAAVDERASARQHADPRARARHRSQA